MKKKNNLTIVCVDTMYHKLAGRAIDKAVQVTGCDNVVILSDQDFYPGSTWIKIKPIDFVTYSKVMFKDMHKYIKTPHYMVIQYDGMPTDPTQWDPEYLNYDYIGAVWPWHPEGSNVGNGGFSLRSKKLAKLCADPTLTMSPTGKYYGEDELICRVYGNLLKSKGIKIAPSSLAAKFSQEIPGCKEPTYGFHGGLSLPYYLDDSHMEFYIDNLTKHMVNNRLQRRIVPGLFTAGRLDLMHRMMTKCVEIMPEFKQVLALQVFQEPSLFLDLDNKEFKLAISKY
jgi:hypothetical protein